MLVSNYPNGIMSIQEDGILKTVLDTDYHLIEHRTTEKLLAYCGKTFGPIPLCSADELENYELARVCARCLESVQDTAFPSLLHSRVAT